MKLLKVTFCLLLTLVVINMVAAQEIQVIEDYEGATNITMNTMANGSMDVPEAFEVIANPDKSDINPSDSVVKFTRAMDGNPWAGFWSDLESPIDMTNMKYIHVQLWKPRTSPAHFKLQGGSTNDIEIESMEPQEANNEWINLVFDFGAEGATDEYSRIVLMPDFAEPVNLDDNIVIYFDNIVLSSSSDVPTNLERVNSQLPSKFELGQNYPNPFNPATRINYTIPENTNVELAVYDMLGRHVATLVDVFKAAGEYNITFDAVNLNSGVYFYRIKAGDFVDTRSMMLIK